METEKETQEEQKQEETKTPVVSDTVTVALNIGDEVARQSRAFFDEYIKRINVKIEEKMDFAITNLQHKMTEALEHQKTYLDASIMKVGKNPQLINAIREAFQEEQDKQTSAIMENIRADFSNLAKKYIKTI